MFTCRSVNEAVPSGKETSIELDVHREQGSHSGAGGRGGGRGPWVPVGNPLGIPGQMLAVTTPWIPRREHPAAMGTEGREGHRLRARPLLRLIQRVTWAVL